MAQTDRLGLPLLAPGQAQKELTHNEALAIADLGIQLVVESLDRATPPGAPALGRCWIVAGGSSGAWSGRAGQIAGWTAAGWLFLQPLAGWQAWALDRSATVRFDGTGWIDGAVRADGVYVAGQRVVGARLPAIAAPMGGTVADGEGRATIVAILTVLRTHGLIAS